MIPALDTHAHIEPTIAYDQLVALRACVIAVTRTLDEFDVVRDRDDPAAVWAVGCHPGLVKALRGFDPARFRAAAATTPVIGEIGLDGAARTSPQLQADVLNGVLRVAADAPRLLTIHSYRATGAVLDALRRHRPVGVVLHWWLGSDDETHAAIDLGARFSINASQARKWPGLALIPPDRILFETDHPFGDRAQSPPRRPGRVDAAERAVAAARGVSVDEVRRGAWGTMHALATEVDVFSMFPPEFQARMLSV